MILNNLFSQIYLINLDIHPERLKEAEEVLKEIGIASYKRFPGAYINEGKTREDRILGCTQSHINIVKEAKKLYFKNILIFEDDILFDKRYLDSFETIVDQVRTFLNNNEWHLFYFGGNHEKPPQKTLNDNVVKVNLTKTTHAYAVNYTAFDQIISFENCKVPIDDLLYSNIQTQKKSYCSFPRLFSQRPSVSYTLNDFRDNSYCLMEK